MATESIAYKYTIIAILSLYDLDFFVETTTKEFVSLDSMRAYVIEHNKHPYQKLQVESYSLRKDVSEPEQST